MNPDNIFKNRNASGKSFGSSPSGVLKDWNAKTGRNVDPSSVFTINDIELLIPPTQIVVKKENLSWSWKTLRSSTATKIASGNAINYVGLTIVFTPDLILHLHRLIVQFKNSPFCHVENSFLRQSLVGHWPVWQSMAFTMTSLNVSNMPGYPGSFVVQLELRLFEYRAFTPNFLYKDEWKTKPMRVSRGGFSDDPNFVGPILQDQFAVMTIETVVGPQYKKGQTILEETSDSDFIDSYSLVKEEMTNENHVASLYDMVSTHAGTVFDMMPLPNQMQRSRPVPPHLSNIYVRYINDLQMRSLYNNFAIDVFEIYTKTGNSDIFNHITIGEKYQIDDERELKNLNRSTRVYSLHTGNVPKEVRDTIIMQMLSFTEKFRIYFDQYVVYEESKILREIKYNLKKKAIERSLALRGDITSEINLDANSQFDPNSGYESVPGEPTDLSKINVTKYKSSHDDWTKNKSLTSYDPNTNNPATGRKCPTDESKLLFYPPIAVGKITSAFGMRDRRKINKAAGTTNKPNFAPHLGVDIVSTIPEELKRNGRTADARIMGGRRIGGLTPIFAPEDGFLTVTKSTTSSSSMKLEHIPPSPVLRADGSNATTVTVYYHLAPSQHWDTNYLKQVISHYTAKGQNQHLFDSNGNPSWNSSSLIKRKVKRGDIIGVMGNTGGSTGPHLHFDVLVDGVHVDPWLFLNAPANNSSQATGNPQTNSQVSSSVSPSSSTTQINNSSQQKRDANIAVTESDAAVMQDKELDLLDADGTFLTAEDLENEIKNVDIKLYGKDFVGPMDDSGEKAWNDHIERLMQLNIDGYYPYIGDYRATNIYKRSRVLVFDDAEANVLNGILKEKGIDPTISEFINTTSQEKIEKSIQVSMERKGLVITGVGGSIQHIVANIPLVGLEYPTHQHLGSIEPKYYFEMNSLSDEAINIRADGLDLEAQFYLAIQTELQRNAKEFRVVPDSYTVSMDTFITRLLGSFSPFDIYKSEETGEVNLMKRCIFENMTVSTVENTPGMHAIFSQFSETNPHNAIEEITQVENPNKPIDKKTIAEVLQKIDDLKLTDHGKMALQLATFSRVMNSSTSEDYFKEKEIDGKDKFLKDKGDVSLAAFEVQKEKVFLKSDNTPTDFAVIEQMVNQYVQDYLRKYAEDKGVSYAGWAIGAVTTGVAYYLFKGQATAIVNGTAQAGSFLAKNSQTLGQVGSKIAPGVNALKAGSQYYDEMHWGFKAASGLAISTAGGYAVGGNIDETFGIGEDLEITTDLIEEAAEYVQDKMEDAGFSLKEKEIIISNTPLDLEAVEILFDDTSDVYMLPDGRVALDKKYLSKMQAHFQSYNNSDEVFKNVGNSTEETYNVGGGMFSSGDDIFVKDVTDFVNAYPEYQSLIFKGDPKDPSRYISLDSNGQGIKDIIQYNKGLTFIRNIAFTMLAEEFVGGLSWEKIKEETYGIVKAEEGKYGPGHMMPPSGMFTTFFLWVKTYLKTFVSNEVANGMFDNYYNYMSRHLGYSNEDIDRLFVNLNIPNIGSKAEKIHKNLSLRKSNPGDLQIESISVEDLFDYCMRPDVQSRVFRNIPWASSTDYSLLRNTYSNGQMTAFASSAGMLFDGEIIDSGANFVNAFGGDSENQLITKLEEYYDRRSNIANSYLTRIMSSAGYGMTEGTINTYLPALGALLNYFGAESKGFTGFYPVYNEILKYLLAARTYDGLGANYRYQEGFFGSIYAGLQAGVFETTPEALGFISTVPGFAWKGLSTAGSSIVAAAESGGVGQFIGTTVIGGSAEVTATGLAAEGALLGGAVLGGGLIGATAGNDITDFFGLRPDNMMRSERDIIKLYQKSSGLSPTGVISSATSFGTGRPQGGIESNVRDANQSFMRFIGAASTDQGKSYQKQKFDAVFHYTKGEKDLRIKEDEPFYLDLESLVTEEVEMQKISEIKRQLETIAKTALQNQEVAYALGMENVFAEELVFDEYSGIECYPDLSLPKHPYYNDSNGAAYSTSPDFYMWNVYEDGPGGLTKEVRSMVYESVDSSVQKSYESIKRMGSTGLVPKNDFGLNIATKDRLTENTSQKIQSFFEGSDVTYEIDENGEPIAVGPCISAFYGGEVSQDTLEYIKREGPRGISKVKEKIENMKKAAGGISDERSKEKVLTKIRKMEAQIDYVRALEKGGQDYRYIGKLSNFHDKSSVASHEGGESEIRTYLNMYEQAVNIEKMFGSKAGYTGDYLTIENNRDVFEDTQDTVVAANDQFSHQFDPKTLKKLAKDSAQDILSEKFSMKRAYPTFKLFFVEEDEFESRFVNFDDFYSFNGVKEFSIVRDRENPGDVATIVLQNVSGTLDGSKRTGYKDIDYFDRKKKGEMQLYSEQGTNLYPEEIGDGDAIYSDEKQQPFASIVMRPGLNVQLRCGYSNDPNMLEVMLSGRVTEISWGGAGDTCEITVQSFGTELTQFVKTDDRSFMTTHQLLGAMMLERELQHFGRFDYGNAVQRGEDKNAAIDFYDYGQDSDKHTWALVNGTIKFTKDWAGTIFIGTLVSALFLGLTKGRLSSVGGANFIANGGRLTADQIKSKSGLFTTETLTNALKWVGGGVRASGANLYKLIFIPAEFRGWHFKTKFFIPYGVAVKEGVKTASKAGDEIIEVITKADKNNLVRVLTGKNSLVRKIFSGYGNDGSKKAWQAFMKTSEGKGLAKLQSKLNSLLSSGGTADEIAEVTVQIQNTLIAAERFARANSAVAGRFAKSVNAGTISGPGILMNVGIVGSTAMQSFQHMFKISAAAGITALGVNQVWNWFDLSNRFGIQAAKRYHAKVRSQILISPADDNLFPPNPMSYLRLGFLEKTGGFWGGALDFTFKAIEAIGFEDLVGKSFISSQLDYSRPGALRDAYDKMKNPEAYKLSKRITVDEAEYFIKGKRIWDIFSEMSKRHPGWIYGVRPYGNKFEYRMFFGVPSQRYWAKPASRFFIQRVNRLRNYLIAEQKDEATLKVSWEKLYGSKDWEINRDLAENDTVDRGSVITEGNTVEGILQKKNQDKDIIDLLQVRFRSKVLKEYLMGLENRFVPFRRYHMLTSEEDIVSNKITASMHNVANAVNVAYYTEDQSVPYESVKMKASSGIPENKINMVNVDFGKNIRSYTAALRFGQGSLLYGMREMYRGELLLLGNHRIQPWDICVIFDSFNQMSGPVEVKSVTHLFSHETGFLTEIVPNAVVIGNEISTYPVLEALKLMMGATITSKEGKIDIDTSDAETYNDGLFGNTDERYKAGLLTIDPEWGQEFQERYNFGEKGEFDLTELLPEAKAADIFRSSGPFVNPEETVVNLVEDLSVAYAMKEEVSKGFTAGSGFGAAGVFLSQTVGRSMAGGSGHLASFGKAISSFKGSAIIMGGTMAAGLAGGVISGFGTASDPTKRWLTVSPLIMTKLMENEAVIVVPLLKDNRPIVSGLSYKDPLSSWKSVLGNLINEALDTSMGINEYITETLRDGGEFWQNYERLSGEPVTWRDSIVRKYYKVNSYLDMFSAGGDSTSGVNTQ